MPDYRARPLFLRALLRAAPAAFRRRYGEEILAFCEERVHERRATGESAARAWFRVVADLTSTIALEWTRLLVQGRDARRAAALTPLVHQRTLTPGERLSVIVQEVQHAIRSLRKSVGFTTAAVLTLALGLASTTAIFSIVESVALKPLPFADADRIVIPETQRIGTDDRSWISYADFMDWRDQKVF